MSQLKPIARVRMHERPGNLQFAGSRRGKSNRVSTLLKDAILYAAAAEGADGNGMDGLIGYLRTSARTERKAFLGLLGKVIPLHLVSETQTLDPVFQSKEELLEALRQRGVKITALLDK